MILGDSKVGTDAKRALGYSAGQADIEHLAHRMLQTGLASPRLPQILIAEDSETAATIMARHLRHQFDILHARDGLEAWQMLAANPDIELVITDIEMPRLSGHELLQRIRRGELPRVKDIPVLVVTAHDEAARREAVANGASDFIVKPVDKLDLVGRVTLHQRLAQAHRPPATARPMPPASDLIDPLTGLKNRRGFFDLGARHLALAARDETDLSLFVVDLDRFRKINETCGQTGGDKVLAEVARLLSAKIRGADVAARIGGEEYAVLLPHTRSSGAALLAERVRIAIAHNRYPVGSAEVTLTVSIGVATHIDDDENLDRLLATAHRRLAMAKRHGGNHVIATD